MNTLYFSKIKEWARSLFTSSPRPRGNATKDLRETDRQRQRDRDRQRKKDKDRDKKTEIETDRQRKPDRNRDGQTETDSQRVHCLVLLASRLP